MPDSDVTISPSGSTKVDTRTVGAGSDEHRQVVVVGDPAIAAAVATILNTVPGASEYGLTVRVAGNVALDGASLAALETVNVGNLLALQPVSDNGGSLTIDGTVALDPGSLSALETVSVANLPAVQPVSDNGASLTVDGTVSVSGAVATTGPLTDAQLRAASVPVSGTFWQATQPVSGPLTDAQLRASAVPIADGGGSVTVDGTVAVSGTVTVDSELPAATALADASANPTTPLIGAANELFNGTTWDRMRGDTTNGLDVDVTRLPSLVAGTANIGDVDVLTLPSIPAGTNNIGDVDVVTMPAVALDAATLAALETVSVNGISGTVSLPTGAATSAKQDTMIGHIDGVEALLAISTGGGYGAVTVTTTVAEVIAVSASRRSLSLYNNGLDAIYVGYNSSLTTNNGMPIPAGGEREITTSSAVWAVAASGSQNVRWMTETV